MKTHKILALFLSFVVLCQAARAQNQISTGSSVEEARVTRLSVRRMTQPHTRASVTFFSEILIAPLPFVTPSRPTVRRATQREHRPRRAATQRRKRRGNQGNRKIRTMADMVSRLLTATAATMTGSAQSSIRRAGGGA